MNETLKIVNIITRLNVGGPARQVILLSKALKHSGNDAYLIAGKIENFEEDMSYLADKYSVPYTYLPNLRRNISIFYDILSIGKLVCLFLRIKPDIIHTHTAKAGFIGRIAAFIYRFLTVDIFFGKKRLCLVIHTFHGNILQGYFGRFRSKMFLYFERLLAKSVTDKIIVLTNQQFIELSEKYKIGNINQYEIVPVVLESSDFQFCSKKRDLIRSKLGILPSEFVIGFVGRLTLIKNPELFITIAKNCLNSSELEAKNLRFLIVGNGELLIQLKKCVKESNLTNKIIFIGNSNNIIDYYCGLDLICITSKNEGTPLVLLEAMASERPTIATDVGGISDIMGKVIKIVNKESSWKISVRERGISVEPNNSEAFVEAILHLKEDEKTKKLISRNGLEYVNLCHKDNGIIKIYENWALCKTTPFDLSKTVYSRKIF